MRLPILLRICSVCVVVLGSVNAAPTSIVYQGSLKQNGALVNGTYPMIFTITNADGSQAYWTSGSVPVVVQEGLYRADLAPGTLDWASIDPYIETRVNG